MRNLRYSPLRREPTSAELGDLPYGYDVAGPLHDPGPGPMQARARAPGQRARAGVWLNQGSTSNFPFRIGLESEQIIPANPLRTYLLIQNKDAGSDMFINFGQKANDFNGVIIVPRGNFEFIGGKQGGAFVPADSVWVLGAAADMEGVLVEGVEPLQ